MWDMPLEVVQTVWAFDVLQSGFFAAAVNSQNLFVSESLHYFHDLPGSQNSLSK